MARSKAESATLFATQAIIQADNWVGVWFDADEDGHDPDSVMTEPVVCWAQASWQVGRVKHSGVVGLIAGHPSLYSPELLEDNFRGYCKRGEVDEFLEGWDGAHTEDTEDEEDASEEDDSSEDDSEDDSDDEDEDN